MTRWGFVLGALALALVVIGTRAGGAGLVGAQSATPAAGTGDVADPGAAGAGSADDGAGPAEAYRAFLDRLTANLGLGDANQVDAAIRTTLKEEVDERQAAGDLSAEEAEAIKARIDAAEVPLGFGVGRRGPVGFEGPFGDGRGHGHGRRGGFHGRDGPRGGEGIELPTPGLPEAPAGGGGADEPADEATPAVISGAATVL